MTAVAHEREHLFFVIAGKGFGVAEIDQQVGSFGGGQLNPGDAEHIPVLIDFQGAANFVVVGDGNSDA
jgi:hypothetical protein